MPQTHWSWRLMIAAAIPLPVLGFPLYWALTSLSWVAVPLLLVYLWLVSALYTAVTAHYTPEQEPGHCPDCGYDLTGNASGICPECGRPVTAPKSERLPW
jgi:hypothetical protein